MPAKILRRGVQNEVDAEFQRPLVERRRERCVDDRFYAMPPADIGEALEVNDVVVGVGRRFADEHARGRADRLLIAS